MTEANLDWNQIVLELGPSLFGYFRGAGFPRSIADDLVQESLIRLVRKHREGKFDSKRGTLKMYAFGIARFVRLEALKAQGSLVYLSEYWDSALEIEADAEQKILGHQLRKAISLLPEPQSEIVLLSIDRDLKLSEISQIMDMPVGTVKSHIHRAKSNLKKILNQTGGSHAGQGTGHTVVTPSEPTH